MKQIEHDQIMKIITDHMKREATLLAKVDHIDDLICVEMDSDKKVQLESWREYERKAMCRHRDIIKELAPVLNLKMKCSSTRVSGMRISEPCKLIEW